MTRAAVRRLEDHPQWHRALQAEEDGQVLSAELLYSALLRDHPGEPALLRRMARLASMRGDAARAAELLSSCRAEGDQDRALIALELAQSLASAGLLPQAESALEQLVRESPDHPLAWLLLGRLREIRGDALGSLTAWFQAVTRAQRSGLWRDTQTTPVQWQGLVIRAIERVREGRRELFFGSFESVRSEFGPQAVRRVERALTGWLREWNATPSNPRQRPRFFYFPDLPEGPYHDPFLQPWARRLSDAFAQIRADALRVTRESSALPNFIDPPAGGKGDEYVDGDGTAPSWKAFFFYRHGQRMDANHALCPGTSSLLESIELCRIHDEAPEILFSVLAPGSHIKAHHGVSNVRLVMHLPLVVPRDCALRLVDHGDHEWKEGRLVMFDDTFLHEAWNRSDRTRLILLMDCWNPHLSTVEQQALKQLIETISGLHLAAKPRAQGEPGGGVMRDE